MLVGGLNSGKRAELRGVNGLRAVAALAVLTFHVWRYGSPTGQPAGFPLNDTLMHLLAEGVALFFALSGFLLYRPFCTALLGAGPEPLLRAYARNRLLRILPAYWTILVLTGLVLRAALIPDGRGGLNLGSLAGRPDLALADVLFLQNYHPSAVFSGIGPAWSLVVEIVFYAALPLLAGLGRAVAGPAPDRRRRLLAAASPPLLLLSIGWATKLVHLRLGSTLEQWDSVVLVNPLYSADLFAYGMLTALLSVQVERGHLVLPFTWRGPVLATAVLLTAGSLAAAERGILPWDAYDSAVGCASALLLAAVVVAPSTGGRRLRALLDARPVAAVGVASYSLYLWHEPLVRLAASHGWTFAGTGGYLVNVVFIGAVAIGLAGATYRFVEAPALRRKAPMQPFPRQAALAVAEPTLPNSLEG